MTHPALEDCHWQRRTGSDGVVAYTRPMVAGEQTLDQIHQLIHGHDQFLFGATFQSNLSLEAIEERLLAALIRLRYYSPLVAAQPQKGIHDNELRSWVYTPVFDNQAAASWARKVLTVKASTKQLPDAESHVCDILSQPLPPNEIFQVHLIGPHQDGQFTLFTYKSHALAEGQSAIDLLATLSDWIINPDAGVDLTWGEEWHNLLPGTNVTLGREKEKWNMESSETPAEIERKNGTGKASHLREPIYDGCALNSRSLLMHFGHNENETITSRLVQAARSEGISITHLFEAAHAIATYAIEPLSAEELAESHVRYFPSITRHHRKAPYDKRELVGNVNTAFTQIIPAKVHCDKTTVRDRVLAISQEVKNNYRTFIANPQHPLMEATLIKLYPLRGPLGVDINANTGEILGLGIIDNKLPLVWRSSDGHHTIRINDVHLGLRQCNKRPMVHLWTLEGKLRIQIQASDVWDESYLARFLDEVIKCALSVC
ncbi:hypothetical protein RhiXN_05257 [Rhizoctonia solani]|uniref:Uncharacterized protein n=1 Tax=Rhizoctonia solani TaxID=456999 RepID=A0A8H8NQ44_9AGAM|nr:uncharacterized protein RhiXN_05257 [Rhizoctonia solani]QRW17255.1 hypothetical protein RhiXN_05257 [Rhizoctonia solani]